MEFAYVMLGVFLMLFIIQILSVFYLASCVLKLADLTKNNFKLLSKIENILTDISGEEDVSSKETEV